MHEARQDKAQSKLTIIYGGQFGSEGKGRIAALIQQQDEHFAAVRVGGANAGHTFYLNGKKVVVQSIPVAAMMGAVGVIGPAGYILPDILTEELRNGYELLGRPVDLLIDMNAAVILPKHMSTETSLVKRIGSTGEGVGACTASKIMREPEVVVSGNHVLDDAFRDENGNLCEWAKGVKFETLTNARMNLLLRSGSSVMIEGTQGYGLSLHTGGFYPYCTSRECTPQALLAETGIGEHNAGSVEKVMVLRTYPIRVAGNSGPLANEINWEILKERTNGYVSIPEKTTVTKKVRRIAEFDITLVQRCVEQTGPTCIAINFLDYVFPELAGVTSPSQFSSDVWKYIAYMEKSLGVKVKYASWGPTDQTANLDLVRK